MKLAIVCRELDSSLGGGLIWTMRFVEWLADAGHDVHVISPLNDSMPEPEGVTLHCLSPRSRTHFAKLAEEQLRRLSPDVSHDMGCGWFADIFHSHVGSPIAFYDALVSVRPWWKRLGTLRLSRLLPRYRETHKLTMRQLCPSRNTLFVALSQKIVADFQNLHEIPAEKIRLIHNGVDTDRFTPHDRTGQAARLRSEWGIGLEETVLLQVARNPELKGVPELIKAAGHIYRSGAPVRVVIVGCKPRAHLLKIAAESGMTERVRFARHTDNIEPYYHLADACIHATHYDACSLTVLEAMAAGLPVVTTRCNGAADLLTHGEDGFVLNGPGDRELTTYLHQLLRRTRRQKMGKSARETAESNSLQQNFRRTFALYKQIAATKQSFEARARRRSAA